MPNKSTRIHTADTAAATPKALLYMRSNGRDQESRERDIVAQQHICQQRVHELGAQVVGEYVDFCSGLRAERPGLTAMLDKLKELERTGSSSKVRVITAGHTRIARDGATYVRIAWAIDQLGAQLMSASEPLSSYEGRRIPPEDFPFFRPPATGGPARGVRPFVSRHKKEEGR